MNTDSKRRAKDKIERLAGQGLDLVTFWRACTEPLRDAVPHHMQPCFYTLDPASLLMTSHFQEALPEVPAEWLEAEYYEDDVMKLADVARSERGLATLHEVTGGDPSSTPRWQANMEYEGDQELIAALRTRTGDVWGALGIYRNPDQPMFDTADLEFVRTIAPVMAEGARRGLLVGEAAEPDGPDAPGLVILTAEHDVESMTPGVERWLEDLPEGGPGRLPTAVKAVAARALRSVTNADDAGEVALSRVLSRSGTWIVLHGAALVSPGSHRVAVIVEAAHPARISSLLMSAYGFTEREQDVTRAVLQGMSTSEIAEHLVVSPHTVQQHLKSIFDRTGVRSRRDLVGKVFFSHYEPRLRDNERRAIDGRPARGKPVA